MGLNVIFFKEMQELFYDFFEKSPSSWSIYHYSLSTQLDHADVVYLKNQFYGCISMFLNVNCAMMVEGKKRYNSKFED